MTEDKLKAVRELYEQALSEHGATPRGVGWRDDRTHELRFDRLIRVIDRDEPVSVNDLGCGYGALLGYLRARGVKLERFRGYDISTSMLQEAKRRHPEGEWILGSELDSAADYSFASGIFNVKLTATEESWRNHVETTLEQLNSHSRYGFAFNLLSTYVDYREPHLYYGDPCMYFDLCKRRFSKNVVLFHDYPLFEWTIIVRR